MTTIEDRIIELEAKLNALHEKEMSRVLTQSRLIEEIIRLENLEVRFEAIAKSAKKDVLDLEKIKDDIRSVSLETIDYIIADLSTKRIIESIIDNLKRIKEDPYD